MDNFKKNISNFMKNNRRSSPCEQCCPEEDIEELLSTTHFDKKTLTKWHKKFMKDYPAGQINKDEFDLLYGKLYKTNFCNHLAEHLFNSFDTNHDGFISFKELMFSLSVTMKGTDREKLEWSFKVYDVDGNGEITLDEICHMANCVRTDKSKEKVDEDIGIEEIAGIFDKVDTDSNGSWSVEEFVDGIEMHPSLAKILTVTPRPLS